MNINFTRVFKSLIDILLSTTLKVCLIISMNTGEWCKFSIITLTNILELIILCVSNTLSKVQEINS